MAEGELLVTFMLSLSLLLVIISAVRRYTRNFIIPGVTFLMFLGAVLVATPIIGFEVDEFYNFIKGLPEIILLVIIPILIFESGRKLKIGQIQKEVIPIGFFAIIGVVLTIIIIGIAVNGVFQIPFIDALLFGAILAAIDPVAVGVIFKKFPIPHKLNIIIEGESLFDDATGVISFNVIKDFFRPISSSKGSPSTENGYGPVKYYCMKCGNEHSEIACPECGSKMKKVGY